MTRISFLSHRLADRLIWADIVVVRLRNLILVMLLLKASWGLGQTSPSQLYTLINGSKLIDDCPICARVPIVVPITGTFGLQLVDQNPVLARYELRNISFRAASGPAYQVAGSGTYQLGGEVSVLQQLFLNTEISDGFNTVNALCMSTTSAVTQPWPKMQIQVDQTNGMPSKVYHLMLVAVPAPQVRSIIPDVKTGNLLFEWEGNGATFQLERAANVAGPFSAVSPVTTNSSFIDVGVLTNSAQSFYRLHPL